jgi:hypothetical protein
MSDWLVLIAMGVGAALVWVGLPLGVMVGLGAVVWKFALRRKIRWAPLLISFGVVLLLASVAGVALVASFPGPK